MTFLGFTVLNINIGKMYDNTANNVMRYTDLRSFTIHSTPIQPTRYIISDNHNKIDTIPNKTGMESTKTSIFFILLKSIYLYKKKHLLNASALLLSDLL
jgi:hypothetical protein